jgi:glycosyltransferase involved in cell wall biosynthesis
MRIVFVLTSLGMGGAEKQTLAVAEGMVKRGHEVVVLALKPRVPEQWPTTVRVVYLGMRKSPASFISAFLQARRFLREFKPDLLHSHCFHANIFARLLRLVSPSLPVVSTVHNVYEGGSVRMLLHRLTDALSRRTVFVSKAAADRFVGLKAVPESKYSVLTNGIDTAEFAPDSAQRAATRSAMGVDSRFVWFTAGRLVPAKDLPNLLDAFRQVRRENPDAELWIAGAPQDAKVIRRNDSKTSFYSVVGIEREMRDSIRWLGLRRDVPALLDAADAFVLASAWEGMPLALGEAMAMEKPVVATDAGGVRELVGDAGIVVEAKNPAALAAAMIATMRQSRESRAACGLEARRRIQEHFDMGTVVDAWETLYKQITANSFRSLAVDL